MSGNLRALVAGGCCLLLMGCESEPSSAVQTPQTVSETINQPIGGTETTSENASPVEQTEPTDTAVPMQDAVTASVEKVLSAYGGEAEVAIYNGTQIYHAGNVTDNVAWSTSKVPLVMAAGTAGLGDPADMAAAIEQSDNEAAMRLWTSLGAQAAPAMQAEIDAIAPGPVVVSEQIRPPFTPFGQTQWTVTDQARFAFGLPCSPHGGQVLGYMGAVIPAQSFGLGTLGGQFKGGWGPDVGGVYLTRQMGVINGYGVAIAAKPSAGTFDSGQAALSELAAGIGQVLAAEPAHCG